MRGALVSFGLSVLCAASVGCADESSVRLKLAEGFHPGKTNVSILGVFKDGRMSTDAWLPLGLPVSAAMGTTQVCEPVFSMKLQRENEPLFTSIDDQTKSDGITEDLLAKLAPSAQGDVILAISMHGSVGMTDPRRDARDARDKSGNATNIPSGGGLPGARGGPSAGGGLAGARGAGRGREATQIGPMPKVFELTATIFSTKDRAPLARLTFDYSGESTDEAVQQFSRELGKLLPQSTCKGWNFADKPKLPDSVAPILEGP